MWGQAPQLWAIDKHYSIKFDLSHAEKSDKKTK